VTLDRKNLPKVTEKMNDFSGMKKYNIGAIFRNRIKGKSC
jgi:hypothetical protein